MEVNEQKTVIDCIEFALAGYGQALPNEKVLEAWMKFLKPFSLQAIRKAFNRHCLIGEFAPRPVDIAKLCREDDGRLSADEAWAIALKAQDENETVVWSEETAEAFFVAKPILDARDKVGARMAFIEAYNRLVAENREKGIACKTTVSLGHDVESRQIAIEQAVSKNRLTYKNPAFAYLGNREKVDEKQLKKIRWHIQKMHDILNHNNQKRPSFAELERQRQAELKRVSAEKVKRYLDERKTA